MATMRRRLKIKIAYFLFTSIAFTINDCTNSHATPYRHTSCARTQTSHSSNTLSINANYFFSVKPKMPLVTNRECALAPIHMQSRIDQGIGASFNQPK